MIARSAILTLAASFGCMLAFSGVTRADNAADAASDAAFEDTEDGAYGEELEAEEDEQDIPVDDSAAFDIDSRPWLSVEKVSLR